MNTYTCDFETSTDNMVKEMIEKGILKEEQAFVWLACKYNIVTSEYDLFNNIDEFMMSFSKTQSECYFHNLKFDGKYILSWLHENGYKNITMSEEHPSSKTFEEVIDEMGNFYAITIYFTVYANKDKNGKLKRKYTGKLTIRDSLKKIPMSVDSMGKAYGLGATKMQVQESWYDTIREPYKHIPTSEEIEYIVRDCETVAKVLDKHNSEDMIKQTVSSNALYQWTKSIRPQNGSTDKEHMKRCKERVNDLFPKLSPYNEKFARNSYGGGWTYCKEEKSHEIQEGSSYDVCSLYPSRMFDCALPYGEPILTKGDYTHKGRELNRSYYDEKYPFKIYRLRACFDLKPKHVPSLMSQGHSKNGSSFIVTTNYMMMELYLTSIDMELFESHYDIHQIEILEIQHYRVSKTFFKAHITKWYDIKESEKDGDQALYQLAKLMLNSLYGKFGNNCMKKNKMSYMDDDDIIRYKVSDENEVEGFSYVPMASAITSHARYLTITSAQKLYDRFVYADTDSLYLIGKEEPSCLDIGLKLGQWNKEHEFERGKFFKQKTYAIEIIEDDKKKTIVKCAGMSAKCKKEISFDEFMVSSKEVETDYFTYKLKTLKGGCHVVKYPFKIKVDNKGNIYGDVGELSQDIESNIDTYFRG